MNEFPYAEEEQANLSGLDMKVAKRTVLTAGLLSDLQKYPQVNGQKMWRIRIPFYFRPKDRHRVIVVYPHAIDIPPLYPRAAAESCGCNCYPPRSERRRRELNPKSTVGPRAKLPARAMAG